MAAEDDSPRKKDRDPILTVGFIVLILAFTVVGGIFINDNYLKSETVSPGVTGDKVSVDYVGSFYGFYNDTGISVFDTSLWSIANNADYKKSYEFSKRNESAYVPLSFTLGGNDNYLRAFMAAAIGLKPGQSNQVCIAPIHGYGALTADDVILVDINNDLKVPLVETMSYASFKSTYNGGADITGSKRMLSPYGWDLQVTYVAGSPWVNVQHLVDSGSIYRMNANVNISATVVGEDIVIEYIINGVPNGVEQVPAADPRYGTTDGSDPQIFTYPGTSDEYQNVKLVKVFYKDREYYITAADDASAPAFYVMKNTNERTGMYLYFSVTRV